MFSIGLCQISKTKKKRELRLYVNVLPGVGCFLPMTEEKRPSVKDFYIPKISHQIYIYYLISHTYAKIIKTKNYP